MKVLVKIGFRIDQGALNNYAATVEQVRAATPQGEYKPSSSPVWITLGAVYIQGDVIEVEPVELAELKVVAPSGALEVMS